MKNNELIAQFGIAQLIKWCFILLLVAAVFCLCWVVLNPYFVYFDIPNGVTAIVVACCIALPWSWQAAVSNRKIKLLAEKEAFKRRNPDSEVVAEKPKNNYLALLWCAAAAVGIYFLIYGSDQLDKINQLNQAQKMVTEAMEHDCIEKCAIYGIERTDLVGPQVEFVNTFEPHSGKYDYLFSWHKKKSTVRVVGRFYNFDGQRWVKPQVIALNWKGKPVPHVAEDNAPDAAPVYTAIRKDFKEVIEDAKPEINNAFMRAKLSMPKMQGKVTVHLMINNFGQVAAVNIDASELGNPDFENNLIFILKGLEFESGEFAPMNRNYTFDFKRNGI